MIWEKLVAGANRIRAGAKESRLLQIAVGEVPRPQEISSRRMAIHRMVLKNTEKSLVLKGISAFWQFLLSVSLSCFGVLLLFFGGTGVCICLIAGDSAFDFLSLWVLLCGIPLCFARQTLAKELEASDLARLFLFRYCGFADFFTFGQKEKSPVWQFSFAGIAFGCLGSLIGVKWMLLGIAVAVLLPVAFAVPEAILPPIFLLFPFLEWLGHPSILLGVFALLSLLFRLPKILSGHRQDLFGNIDRLILLFGALLILDGVVTAAEPDYGGLLLSVYLFSAWFALRPALLVPRWRNRIFLCFLLSGSICSGIGIFQYVSGGAEMKWLERGRFDLLGGRVCATFTNPNLLAVYLLVVFGVSLGWIFKLGKDRLFGWVPLLLSIGCLIVTWTRGAWLGALAATCFFLLFLSPSSLAALLFFPVSLPGVALFLPEGIRARLYSIGNLTETSSRYRLETWKGVLRLLWEYPFGIGSGEKTFHAVYPLFAVSGTESVMHAHNVYLQIAVQHGLVGLFLLLALLFLLFRGFFACWMKGQNFEGRNLFLGTGAALVGLLTMGFFDHLWYQPSLFYLFGMLAAGLSAATLLEGETANET